MAKAKVEEPTTTIYFRWATVAPDPVQYKPYNPVLAPVNITIPLEVPDRYLIKHTKDETILSPEGMAYACKELAKAIFVVANNLRE